jgi:hypothetical protein
MHRTAPPWRRRAGLASLVCLALCWGSLAQGFGWNQTSHYALIRALAEGTPTIDRSLQETGVAGTGDISEYRGHVYSNKAPGLAFVTLPAYLVMKAAGKAKAVHDPTGQMWFLGLWGAVLPGFVLLLLVRRIADDFQPGFGTAAAVTLGLATLILPFSTLFFSHVLSALLDFGAFAVLWYERQGPGRLAWVGVAGVLAGYAVTTEFPNAIAAAALGCYAVTRTGLVRRGLAYGLGAILGLVPLLAYNQWAFGSPVHVSYQSTVGFGSTGSFFLGAPSLRQAVEVLFAPTGLLRTSPVVAVAAAATFLLFRRGRRAEALLIAAICLGYFVFEASYAYPFGGGSPGPRQLIPMLPFLSLPLAVAFRRYPATTIALAAASAVQIVVLTLTVPIYATFYPNWFDRFFLWQLSRTALGLAGAPENVGIAVFFAAAVLAVVLAAAATSRPNFYWSDALSGASLLVGWVVIANRGPRLLNSDRLGNGNGAVFTLLVCSAIAFAAVILPRVVAIRRD